MTEISTQTIVSCDDNNDMVFSWSSTSDILIQVCMTHSWTTHVPLKSCAQYSYPPNKTRSNYEVPSLTIGYSFVNVIVLHHTVRKLFL